MRLAILLALILIILADFTPVQAQSENFFSFGQIRTGYYGSYNHNPEINKDDTHEWRTRIRLGAGYNFSDDVSVRARFAGRYSTQQGQFRFWFDDHLPDRGGIRLGESTIDVIEFRWKASQNLMIHAGRFQSNYSLRSFVTKGLHRYDNPNTLISWTDGILLKWSFTENWNLEYTAEYNSPSGPGSIARQPLDFDESASRFSHTLVLTDTQKSGDWLQREIGVHIIPSSLPIDGELTSYSLISTRLLHKIPGLTWFDANYSFGIEAGFAPNAPATPQFHDRENAYGFQAVLSVRNILEHNNFGVLYGFADPGLLISPSFRPNSHTLEIRYQRMINQNVTAEVRYRYRTNPFATDLTSGVQDGDIWARLTYNF